MKFLIVEDDLVSQELLKEILSMYGHCETAGDGQEGLGKFLVAQTTEQPYNVVFLDIMMPVMDGQETLIEMRKLEARDGMGGRDMAKIVMTTALDDPKTVMKAFTKGGCDAYIKKPIDRKELEKTLRALGLQV